MADFKHLFTPIKVGSMVVPNRIAESCHSIGIGRADGLPDDKFIAYHANKAKNGVGWIANQTWTIGLPSPLGSGTLPVMAPMPVWKRPDFLPRMKAFCDEIHRHGSVAVFQLTFLTDNFGPSPVQPQRFVDFIPHELESEEIDEMVQRYAEGAAAFRAAGADAVEIHSTHDTNIEWFMSPHSNMRTDEYGGSLENRTRFARRVLAAIKAAAGRDLNVGMSFNGDQFNEEGYNLEDARQIAARLAKTGDLDFIDVDVGSDWGDPACIAPMYYPLGTFLYAAAAIKSAIDIPVLYRGRVNDVIMAERALAEGQADIVAMTRAGIADPEFARKAREGRLDDIRKCVACNTCIKLIVNGGAAMTKARCAVNPVAGRELEWGELQQAGTKKRVVVIGAGPAGLEAARVARERGHEVTVLEKGPEIGGALNMAAKAPAREGFLDLVRWQSFQHRRLGTDIRLNTEASAASVLALNPDAVVIAVGARPIGGDFEGADAPNVVQAWDVLDGKVEVGQNVLIAAKEDHYETVSVADYLANRGKQVEILHHWLMVGREIDNLTRPIVYARLHSGHVKMTLGWEVKAVRGKTVIARDVHSGEERAIEGIDTVVVSYGGKGDSSLYRELKGKVKDLYLAGSAYMPRQLMQATTHGHELGRMI